jgi:hypothetical protein
VKYVKLRIPKGVPLPKERKPTMANDVTPCPKKTDIGNVATDAKAKVDKVIAAHPELKLDLQPVSDSLQKIASDPHHL